MELPSTISSEQVEAYSQRYKIFVEVLAATLSHMIVNRDLEGIAWLVSQFSGAVVAAGRHIRSNDMAN